MHSFGWSGTKSTRRMASYGSLRRVALVRTDVSEEFSVSIIRMARIGELRTLAVTSNRRIVCLLLVTANVVPSSPILNILMMEALRLSETSVLTRAAWRNIPEDAILHSHRHNKLKSYISQLELWSFIGLLNQPWIAKILGEGLPHCRSFHYRSHYDLTRTRTKTVAVGSPRLTVLATARPNMCNEEKR
jgi:hypothetical protein